MQFDDEIVVDSGSVGSITNISVFTCKTTRLLSYVNCINVTAEAKTQMW